MKPQSVVMNKNAPMGADAVVSLLDSVADALRRHDRNDLLARVDAARARFADPTCRVVVCGEFKKGKSSLLNALLGARVCATDADIATAVPTYLRYGEHLEAHALLEENPQSARGAEVSPSDADDVATGHAGSDAPALEIRLPRELLRGGIILVDTPGISGGLASAHAGIALRALALADVVVFVADAGMELGAAELEFLRQATQLCPRVTVAVTKTDLYPQWPRILEADAEHLRAADLAIDLLPLSSPLRHHGLQEQDWDLVAESGFPQLTAHLVDERARVVSAGGASTIAVAVGALSQLVAQVTAEQHSLDVDDPGSAEQRAAWASARAQASDLRGAGSRWQQVLYDNMADMSAEVELDLTVRMRGLRHDASAHIADMPGTRIAADLSPWLQRRLCELLLDHQRLVRTQAEQVADAVAEQFGSATWELRQGLDLDSGMSTPALDEMAFMPSVTTQMSRFDRSLVALRGGSTGAAVSHASGLLLGLAFPVVLPVTVVLAGVLAGRSWRSAQSAQLRALRADTDRAVAAYLEQVDTIARKNSRDTVRGLQRRLRETFTERATELFTTTAKAVETLTGAMTQGTQTRMQRRSEVDAELSALHELQSTADQLISGLVATHR